MTKINSVLGKKVKSNDDTTTTNTTGNTTTTQIEYSLERCTEIIQCRLKYNSN